MQSQAAAEGAGAVCGCARSAALEKEVAKLKRLLAAAERELAAEREQGVERAAARLALDALVAAYRKELAAKDAEIKRKDAQLKELRREQFGSKSEVVGGGGSGPPAGTAESEGDAPSPDGQDESDKPPPDGKGESDKPPPDGKGGDRRRRGRQPGAKNPGRTDREHVPKRTEVREPEVTACPDCGQEYRKDGHRKSTIYELELEAVAREIVRLRLRPQCDCRGTQAVLGPPAPRLRPGTQLGTTVWAFCLVQIFALLRTQASTARDLGQLCLEMKRATLSTALRRMIALFQPVVDAIERAQAGESVLYVDETTWPVQQLEGRGGRQRWWLWVCVTARAVRFRALPSRASPSGAELLRLVLGAGAVTLVCDRWSACKALARRAAAKVRLAWCWAHQRRDFRRVGTGYPELKEWSLGWLRSIGELFHLARKRREAWEPGLPLAEQGAAFQALQGQLERAFERLMRRARRELECLAEHWEGASGRLRALVEAQGRALHSLLVHEDGLGVFVGDPQVAPDSNAAERALRGPVIGRKTSFGSGSEDGAGMAALMYSVFGTLKLWKLNYYAWTLDYLNACARNGGQAPEDLSPWLPWEMDEARKAELSQPVPLAGPADSGKDERALPLAA